MAIVIPIVAGISGLITGIWSGYYIFSSDKSTEEIKDTGIINNSIKIEKEHSDIEIMWILRIIAGILLIAAVYYVASKMRKLVTSRCQGRKITESNSQIEI